MLVCFVPRSRFGLVWGRVYTLRGTKREVSERGGISPLVLPMRADAQEPGGLTTPRSEVSSLTARGLFLSPPHNRQGSRGFLKRLRFVVCVGGRRAARGKTVTMRTVFPAGSAGRVCLRSAIDSRLRIQPDEMK